MQTLDGVRNSVELSKSKIEELRKLEDEAALVENGLLRRPAST